MILLHLRQPIGAWVLGCCWLIWLSLFILPRFEKRPTRPSGFDRIFVAFAYCCVFGVIAGEKLRWFHVIGAISGLVGTVVLVSGSASLELNRSEYLVTSLPWPARLPGQGIRF